MNFEHEIIIIGAGPIGLYFASLCEEAKLDYIILEGSNVVGGQIAHLYPEKEVVDLPNIPSIKAIDYIKLLEKKIDLNKVVFDERVVDIKTNKINQIITAKNQYFCKKLIIATGLGTAVPRPLGVEHEDECENIIYSIKTYDHLANKRVAIFGGGDSALDWSKMISKISDNVHLIHRRDEFRGNPETIKDCKNLAVHLSYIPLSIDVENGKAKSVTIKKVTTDETLTIDVDYIFVNFGNVAKQYTFPFEMVGSFIKVDENLRIKDNVFAIGDVAQYDNKKRRMAPGIEECKKVFNQIID